MDRLEQLSDITIKLLTYHQSGNATSLRAILDQSFEFAKPQHLDDRYWRANLRLALELSGHLEFIETASTQKWTSTSPLSRIPRSKYTVEFSSKALLYSEYPSLNSAIKPAITTNDGFTIWQVPVEDKELSLKGRLYEHLPSKGRIEESVCDFIRGGPDFSVGIWETFDFSQFRWCAVGGKDSPRQGLFKNSDHRSGKSVWLLDEKGNSWKFIFPEWAMLFAMARLNVDFSKIFKFSQGTLVIPRTLKMPRILLKELVLSSDQIHIDWNLNFHCIDHDDYISLTNFLQKRGFAA